MPTVPVGRKAIYVPPPMGTVPLGRGVTPPVPNSYRPVNSNVSRASRVLQEVKEEINKEARAFYKFYGNPHTKLNGTIHPGYTAGNLYKQAQKKFGNGVEYPVNLLKIPKGIPKGGRTRRLHTRQKKHKTIKNRSAKY